MKKVSAQKCSINQDFFKTWSRDMAYIFGLWFAKGRIYKGQIFDITLHAKDKYILKCIAEKLGFEGNLQNASRQMFCMNFSCVVIYNDIIALGGTENKNKIRRFPNIPDKFLSDFIRGYFDGNGSIMLLKNNRVNSKFICTNKSFLDTLFMILRNKAGIDGGSYNSSNVSLKFGKRDSVKLGQYMYQNNPKLFLLRKRQKFNMI